jgi:hypothetical protein
MMATAALGCWYHCRFIAAISIYKFSPLAVQ